jgi:Tfp pilus assembly protein PilN
VNLDQFDLTTELEDHIALLDAELSAARVQAAPAQQLRQMESTREQLTQSLQRVSYAHSLLNL